MARKETTSLVLSFVCNYGAHAYQLADTIIARCVCACTRSRYSAVVRVNRFQPNHAPTAEKRIEIEWTNENKRKRKKTNSKWTQTSEECHRIEKLKEKQFCVRCWSDKCEMEKKNANFVRMTCIWANDSSIFSDSRSNQRRKRAKIDFCHNISVAKDIRWWSRNFASASTYFNFVKRIKWVFRCYPHTLQWWRVSRFTKEFGSRIGILCFWWYAASLVYPSDSMHSVRAAKTKTVVLLCAPNHLIYLSIVVKRPTRSSRMFRRARCAGHN